MTRRLPPKSSKDFDPISFQEIGTPEGNA